ncbi:PTS system N-acetylglucosamine-specific transporter subunit IIA [Klebsiella pneumoniae subsp. ozaenae]|uniref:PTS system glucose-specific EIIA component n=1 Tax=Klebsiella pneumoniae subsp. ozaenae TaxID=574 RepID=A0A378BTY6_KLEPO|nr:PTS system N-acetylglucosamine-specific transporter subunit IIA [Klebsiella pneumoniae subsp. ozaenae]
MRKSSFTWVSTPWRWEGKGFKRLVEEARTVKAGEPILEMDLDFLNANARSMISPVVCSNSDDYSAAGDTGER